jgi:mannose-6-phosphate isomerase class I
LQKESTSSFESATSEILLIIDGNVAINTGTNELEFHKGDVAFITSHQHVSLKAAAKTYLFRASVPVHGD